MFLDIYKVFQESAHEIYEIDREKLVADFFKEAFNRDCLLNERKVSFENYAHATVSLTKSRLYDLNKNFGERKVEIESSSVVIRDFDKERIMKREAIACSEIRNLVNIFNNKLWPKNRYQQYQEALKKTNDAVKMINDLNMKTEDYLKEISTLENQFQKVSRDHLVKSAELKSEHIFMIKLMQKAQEKIKCERSFDHEKLKHLSDICDKTEKIINEKRERAKLIETATKICSKYERISDELDDFESSEDFPKTIEDKFFKKLAKVEADCIMLKNFKASILSQNKNLKIKIKETIHNIKVQQNILMLRLDPSPALGEIVQVSHQISQIKAPIKLRKRWKLCKDCKRDVNNM